MALVDDRREVTLDRLFDPALFPVHVVMALALTEHGPIGERCLTDEGSYLFPGLRRGQHASLLFSRKVILCEPIPAELSAKMLADGFRVWLDHLEGANGHCQPKPCGQFAVKGLVDASSSCSPRRRGHASGSSPGRPSLCARDMATSETIKSVMSAGPRAPEGVRVVQGHEG